MALPPLALATSQMGLAVLVLAAVTDFGGVTHILDDPLAATGLIVGGGILGTAISFSLYYYLLDQFGAVASSLARRVNQADCFDEGIATALPLKVGKRLHLV
ncbi:hypothetical protein [Caballeronia zhejiangensis]|uniref:hypothetical protein n=1 Tax=Caballeronia zhejiangensis TaxID=871203 RepID=UPI001185E221|nr:hypothetical protein [Caballeronia zhejiangensis]